MSEVIKELLAATLKLSKIANESCLNDKGISVLVSDKQAKAEALSKWPRETDYADLTSISDPQIVLWILNRTVELTEKSLKEPSNGQNT